MGKKETPQDDKLDDAIRLILREKLASISLLQRRLQLGYNRAFRIMEQMEQMGVVGQSKGAKPREILIDNYDHVNFK